VSLLLIADFKAKGCPSELEPFKLWLDAKLKSLAELETSVPEYVYRVMRAARQGEWEPFTPAPGKKEQPKSLHEQVMERMSLVSV
jgi:hypothetical protein